MSFTEELEQRIRQYAQRNGSVLGEQLGYGLHGIQAILRALEGYGIFMVDVHPGNVSFGD